MRSFTLLMLLLKQKDALSQLPSSPSAASTPSPWALSDAKTMLMEGGSDLKEKVRAQVSETVLQVNEATAKLKKVITCYRFPPGIETNRQLDQPGRV